MGPMFREFFCVTFLTISALSCCQEMVAQESPQRPTLQAAPNPHKLAESTFVTLDQTHRRLQNALRADSDAHRQRQVARGLERLIDQYEKVLKVGARSRAIGILLNDLGEARADMPQKVRALDAAVSILANYVGQDSTTNLVYAQAVDRLAQALLNPTTIERVTPTLMRGLKLLSERQAVEAEAALLAAWSYSFDDNSITSSPLDGTSIPSFADVVQHAAEADESNRSKCTRFYKTEIEQADLIFNSGQILEAHSRASRIVRSAIFAQRSGCNLYWTPSDEQSQRYNVSTDQMSQLIEFQIRAEIARTIGTPPGAGEGYIEHVFARFAKVATINQFKEMLPLLRGKSMSWYDKNKEYDLADVVVNMIKKVSSPHKQPADYVGATALIERLAELRPSTTERGAGGWGKASDVIFAAEFHLSKGSRTQATRLARLLIYGFPYAEVSVEERARGLFILARNAADEGDTQTAGRMIAEAVSLFRDGDAVKHLELVSEALEPLPEDVWAIAREPILTLAARAVPANLYPKHNNRGTIISHGFEYAVVPVAVRYFDQALFDRILNGTQAINDISHISLGLLRQSILNGRESPAWLMQIVEAAIPKKLPNERGIIQSSVIRTLPLLRKKDYREILVRIGDSRNGSSDCDFGQLDILRYVAEERSNGRPPTFAGAEAVLRQIYRGLCAGNSLGLEKEAADIWRNIGKIWWRLGEPQISRAYLDPSAAADVELLNAGRNSDAVADAVNQPERIFDELLVARVRSETGDTRGALARSSEITRMITARVNAAGAANDRVRETMRFHEPLDFHLVNTALLADQGTGLSQTDLASAFDALQLRRVTGAAVAAARLSARLASTDPALAAALRERQDAAEHVELLGRQQQAAEDDASKARIALSIRSALENQERINRNFATRFPRAAVDEVLEPLPLAQAQSQLRQGEALVVSASTGTEVILFVATRERAGLVRAARPQADIIRLLQEFREGIYVAGGQSTFPRFRDEAALELHDALIAPLDTLLAGVQHLTFVVDGPLESVPFVALVDGQAGDRPRYLIERFSISHLPGVRSLVAPAAAVSRSQLAYLGVGDPVLGPPTALNPTRGLGSLSPAERARSVAQMPSLPATRLELQSVSQRFSRDTAALLLGPDATEAKLKAEQLGRFGVIHFATHAVVAGELSGIAEPGIAMTPPAQPSGDNDGLLTATEIGALNLSADLVILSACNTAASDGRPNAEGLSGLARAFIGAGARNLLVSHWAVLSGPTGALMERFAEASAGGAPPALAMRTAMLRMLADTGNPDNQRPVIWAPFFVVGRGG